MALITTAVLVNGVVDDVERYDEAAILKPHERGVRIPCPDYVRVGWRHDGMKFLMPDGSPVPQELIDADSEAKDLSDMLVKLQDLKPEIDLMKTVNGTNGERILRLEKAVVILYRACKRLTKTIA